MSSPGEQQPLLAFPYEEENENVPTEPPKSTLGVWRENTSSILESRLFHTFVITLIVIDATCVLADLGYTVLSDTCSPLDEGPAWLEVLATISLAITTVFLIEIPVTLWACGFGFYNPFSDVPHAVFHLFDAVIIITTFILEFFLEGSERELAGLLIILRLWRLVKLVGGIAVGAAELEEGIAKELEETRRQLDGTTTALAKARDENRKLRGRVAWLESGGSEGTEF
ncbi:hypothetical protein BDR07DRAFT_1606143 [Suillus spraguei]|nr:hypothetical protein BDR07DRAFT_1606143 [Suillus spraguei]